MIDAVSDEAMDLLLDIVDHEHDYTYWRKRFEGLTGKEDSYIRELYKELIDCDYITVNWASNAPYFINIHNKGRAIAEKFRQRKKIQMSSYEEEIENLISRSDIIAPQNVNTDTMAFKMASEEWMNDVKIFSTKYLSDHPLKNKLDSLLFHGDFFKVIACIRSISKDKDHIEKANGILETTIPVYKAKMILEYDVFISHANKDKADLVEELYLSLKQLGINIFYDKESLEWGDNWKERILDGTKKAEFAIIVISENFFGREWTEKELHEFLNRQNRNGQKLILPILHNITADQLRQQYNSLADIQAISSANYTCDQIALLFAGQLIKRLKAV